MTQLMTRAFAYLPPFISQILGFISWTVLIFIFDSVTVKTGYKKLSFVSSGSYYNIFKEAI